MSTKGKEKATQKSAAGMQHPLNFINSYSLNICNFTCYTSEFFSEHQQIAGFDNPGKSLFTSIREFVENSLDAAESIQVLPEIDVKIGMYVYICVSMYVCVHICTYIYIYSGVY